MADQTIDTTAGFTVSSSATFTGFAYKVEHLE